MSRDSMLNDIRTALGRTAGQPPAPPRTPSLQVPQLDAAQRVHLFVERFVNLAGKAFVVHGTDSVVPAITELLAGKHAVASNSPLLTECGITALAEVHSGFTDREQLRAACAEADIGITSVDYALAETGTFVMLASAEDARLISLLPPAHIAVIPRAKILANLDELLTIIPDPSSQTSSMVLITGPSRTADIEQILVRGVHGPGEVYAVIVE